MSRVFQGSEKVHALANVDDMRQRIRRSGKLKGRQGDENSDREIRDLLGPPPEGGFRRDLLIEFLHRINDAWRGLQSRHLVALARIMNIAMAEVYEVTSFYHHFEIVGDGATRAPLTVRICDGLSCEMAGAQALLQRLPQLLGHEEVRIVAAPCLGRCEQAPVAVVHQCPVPRASAEGLAQLVRQGLETHPDADGAGRFDPVLLAERSVTSATDATVVSPGYCGYEAYRQQGGYALAASVASGKRDAEAVIKSL